VAVLFCYTKEYDTELYIKDVIAYKMELRTRKSQPAFTVVWVCLDFTTADLLRWIRVTNRYCH